MIPAHCSFITDKRDDSNQIVGRLKNLIKSISIILYDPNLLIKWDQNVLQENDLPKQEYLDEAKKLIDSNKINFLESIE